MVCYGDSIPSKAAKTDVTPAILSRNIVAPATNRIPKRLLHHFPACTALLHKLSNCEIVPTFFHL